MDGPLNNDLYEDIGAISDSAKVPLSQVISLSDHLQNATRPILQVQLLSL